MPAVTVPSLANAGRSFARPSSVVSGRGSSSLVSSPPPGSGTGAISPWKTSFSIAAAARRWLSTANCSWASRVTPYFVATRSAVMPIGM